MSIVENNSIKYIMKKIFLIAGIAFSFIITSCNSDADDLLISS